MPRIDVVGASSVVEASGSLLDACDEARSPVEFSCRSGTCGSCRVDVIEGARLLDDAGDDERRVLGEMGAAPTHRLACRVIVRDLRGTLRLLPVGVPPRP